MAGVRGRHSTITIDCGELTADEKLALASRISDEMRGRVVALVRGPSIVLDELGSDKVDPGAVEEVVKAFAAHRGAAAEYTVERRGDQFVVHSPMTARGRRQNRLPDNVKQCPFCGFVTPYDEVYIVHVRAHGFT